jgi:type VI protein secretion system component Hcp
VDQNKTDQIMQFVLHSKPVAAECSLDVDAGDPLMTEFAKHTGYHDHSNFFEVGNFQMGLSLKEDDQGSGALSQKTDKSAQQAKDPAAGQFARWRSATDDEAKTILYPLEFDKFSFNRTIDAASPVFFSCCCSSTTFDKAVLVKRLSQGHHGGVARPAVGFLRIEFVKVLITGINWNDGEVVTEQCEFICQELKIRYRQRKADGSVSAEIISKGAEMAVQWPTARSRKILGNTGQK